MAIAILPSVSLDFDEVEHLSTVQALWYVEHKEHIIHVGKHSLWRNKRGMHYACLVSIFKKAYSEKWQEIQAEVALLRLKNA